MARPYSKKTVDQAEEICLVYASAFDPDDGGIYEAGPYEAAAAIGVPPHATAFRVACGAIEDLVPTALGCGWSRGDLGVEAAALIRSGWMIGDPVEILLPVESESTTVSAEEPLREDEKAFFVQDHLADGATPEAAFVQPLEVARPGGTEPYVRDPSRPEAGTVIDLETIGPTDDALYNGDYGSDS